MPFACRVLKVQHYGVQQERNDPLTAHSVSELMVLSQSLGALASHAVDIFSEIARKTEITGQRIHDGKERILKLCDHLPTIEEMFVDQSPAVFYDHPFAEQEYIRNDPVPDQLLFFRKTANKSVDARRSTADPLPVMTALDPLSGSAGPCIKQLSDPDFFIKQFLVNAQRSNQKRAQKQRESVLVKRQEVWSQILIHSHILNTGHGV